MVFVVDGDMILARYSSYRKIGTARNFLEIRCRVTLLSTESWSYMHPKYDPVARAIFPTPWLRLGYRIGTLVEEIEIIMRNSLFALLSNLKAATASLSIAILSEEHNVNGVGVTAVSDVVSVLDVTLRVGTKASLQQLQALSNGC